MGRGRRRSCLQRLRFFEGEVCSSARSGDVYQQQLEYIHGLKDDGILIIDEDLVEIEGDLPETVKVYKIPATRIADKEVGSKQATNVVMLGALTVITKILSVEGLKARIEERWPRFVKTNMLALELGMKAGEEALAKAE